MLGAHKKAPHMRRLLAISGRPGCPARSCEADQLPSFSVPFMIDQWPGKEQKNV